MSYIAQIQDSCTMQNIYCYNKEGNGLIKVIIKPYFFSKTNCELFACHNAEYLPVISMNSTHQDTCNTYVLGPHGQSKFA